ncbi:alpha-tubulin N-acetyltransferase 1-like [Drosophila obscura]|uniref:alpha-tubulin N-acetyltransferase 1-like n=1 Tax=Drosophila obscura TaxID=7282 RepID=UPI001BB2C0D7|nr:alpha-tubulin N-acetyltransferase 1-like [Drosophila obscura]
MATFKFDIKPLFPEAIIKVSADLLPQDFAGSRVHSADTTCKIAAIVDYMGQQSATAQELVSPVTTAQRLGKSDNQTIYLLGDATDGPRGSVLGLLKVGTKDLYLYDETGQPHQVKRAPAILDFYVHESRQRCGLGKRLFEAMLAQEKWSPAKLSVDRPSPKLILFMARHYGLVRTIPQANHFVVYEGYFNDMIPSTPSLQGAQSVPAVLAAATAGSNVQRASGEGATGNYRKRRSLDEQLQQGCSARNSLPLPSRSNGSCSMAEIIQLSRARSNNNSPAGEGQSSTGNTSIRNK